MLRNRVAYGLFLGAAIVFVYFYPGLFSSMFFYTLLLIPISSLVYTLYVYYKFSYIQSVDKKFVTKGEVVTFNVKIVNETKMIYPYIEIQFYGGNTVFTQHFKTKKMAVLPNDSSTYPFILECQYRGYYEVGLKEIKIKDFLGFFSFRYKVFEPKYITVYPRIISLERFPVSSNKLSDLEGMLSGRGQEQGVLSDVRKYSYGDGLKKVHWKLSARKNEIMVKNYESTDTMQAIVLLDLTENAYGILENTILEDKIVEVSVAVLNYCLLRQIETHFIYHNGSDMIRESAKEYSHFETVYNTLFKIQFESKTPFDEMLQLALREEHVKNNIILITSRLDEKLYRQMGIWRELSHEVILIYISTSELMHLEEEQKVKTDEIFQPLQEIGIKTYEVHMQDDIKTILES
ncbi:DUF58 domain-containing protein [Cellulosilyticum sp. I15G10I2]|uniref:DUF58 domain-containing protein n=1 Tax=Cellulosilyticum sp. I15G10I2 TaxID=1892843 RepID=UPI00085C95F3|nr:DUF58 domain-containing protein [Cellulosilyticum sp. I15G10I2]